MTNKVETRAIKKIELHYGSGVFTMLDENPPFFHSKLAENHVFPSYDFLSPYITKRKEKKRFYSVKR